VKESLRALLDDEARPPTLGERLDGDGRRIAARHEWTSAVGARLALPIRRAEELQGLFSGRFERTEASDDGPVAVPTGVSPRITGPAPQVEGRSTRPERDDGRPLPVDVRSRLRDFAGPAADVLRVHSDAAADRTAVAHAADAVTMGADVYVRDGRFRPDEPAGFALLAHEATHVSAALERGGAGSVPAGGPAAEEALALGLERLALGRERLADRALHGGPGPDGRGGPPSGPGSQVPASVGRVAGPPPGRAVARPGPPTISPADGGRPGASPPALGTAVPRAAAVDRPPDPQPPPFDVEVLRRELSRELMGELLSRLRSDAERGG